VGLECARSSVSTTHQTHGRQLIVHSSLNIYSSVLSTSSAVYVIGLSKSFASYTLHLVALSPLDGTVITTTDVPSSIVDGPQSILHVKRLIEGTEVIRVVWLEGGKIQSVGLTPELSEKPVTVKGAAYHQIIDTGLGDHGMFIAIKEDGAGRAIKLNEQGTNLKVIWEYADSVSTPTRNIST
jgi:ER membrane protein complex subunit 1